MIGRKLENTWQKSQVAGFPQLDDPKISIGCDEPQEMGRS
jgi:hypothetical protein